MQPSSDSSGTGPRSITMDAIGQSESFLDFQERLSRVAPVDRSVLIIGERGTGKALAAARLHYLSGRWQADFVTLDCASLTPSLIEAELFGHEKGAFTGAVSQRKGRLEIADGGSLFLDEIGNIPMQAQEKILRAVEYGTFERVGSTVSVEADVRVVGATHEDLAAMAEKGLFRRDLLDRLSFEVLFLPPLRDRHGDVMLLADHFARRMAYELDKQALVFSPKAVATLEQHDWPGNIRELKNVVERAVYRADSGTVEEVILDPFQNPYAAAQSVEPEISTEETQPDVDRNLSNLPLKEAVKHLEVRMLKEALEKSRFNQKQAAGILGLTYDQFRGLMRKYASEVK